MSGTEVCRVVSSHGKFVWQAVPTVYMSLTYLWLQWPNKTTDLHGTHLWVDVKTTAIKSYNTSISYNNVTVTITLSVMSLAVHMLKADNMQSHTPLRCISNFPRHLTRGFASIVPAVFSSMRRFPSLLLPSEPHYANGSELFFLVEATLASDYTTNA